jgi:predicted dinucleotide-utilizing enzyme
MMLSFQLQGAIKELDTLIALSLEDIENIKEAKHNPQFDRLSIKEEKIKSFEHKKAMIDYEISKLMTQEPVRPLSELLDEEQHQQLETLKVRLSTLRTVNQQYAKMVLSVGAFFNTLLERIMPTQMNGYRSVATRDSAFLEVRA